MVRDGGIQHYYTLFGKDKGQVVIGDPDPSKNVIKLSLERILTRNGQGLLYFLNQEKTTLNIRKRYLVFFRFYQFYFVVKV